MITEQGQSNQHSARDYKDEEIAWDYIAWPISTNQIAITKGEENIPWLWITEQGNLYKSSIAITEERLFSSAQCHAEQCIFPYLTHFVICYCSWCDYLLLRSLVLFFIFSPYVFFCPYYNFSRYDLSSSY